jgi:flagellar hook-associated protein 1
MSILGIIQAGSTGMSASQTVMRTISNNIANVNTPGYARERVSLEALAYGSGQGGVKVSSIDRVTDRYLDQSVRTAAGDAAYNSVLADYHGRLQSLLGKPDGSNTLASQVDGVFASLQDLSTAPTDAARRRDVTSKLGALLDSSGQLADNIQSLRTDANAQLSTTLTNVNDLLANLGELNDRIVEQTVTGRGAGPLIEQRHQALTKLSQLVDVEAHDQSDGSMMISTRSGLVLLDKSVRRTFAPSTAVVAAESTFPAIEIRSLNPVTGAELETRQTLDDNLLGGKVKALIDLRDKELPQTATTIGQFVRSLSDEFNAVHNGLSTVPPPLSLVGRNSGLTSADKANFTGNMKVAITDVDGKVLATATVNLSTKTTIADIMNDINAQLNALPTPYGVATLVDGTMTLTATGTGKGVIVADDPASPSNRGGRSFAQVFGLNDLVRGTQPTSYATGVAATDLHQMSAGSFKLNLRDTDNRLLMSDTITPVVGGTFNDILIQLNDPTKLGRYATFSLDAKGELKMTPLLAARSVALGVETDTTSRGSTGVSFTNFFGISSSNTAQAAKSLKIRDDIKANPANMAMAKFDYGTAVGAVAVGKGDDRGANALRDIATKSIGFAAAGNVPAQSVSVSGYISSLIADVSGRASRAAQARDDSTALATAVSKQRDDYSGVNLDEELGNMVVYQNSYNASARLITTARDMYDTLLSLVQ